jgi:hypothetical protein
MEASGILGSIRTPKDDRNMDNQPPVDNQQSVRPEQQDQRDTRFGGNTQRHHIVPMFQSDREAIFFIMLSLNMGGADLSAEAVVDEAIRQADALAARNKAVWYRKRIFPSNNGKDSQDSRPPQKPSQT